MESTNQESYLYSVAGGIAAGAVIALASDFRIFAREASIAFLFQKVGLTAADMGAVFLLPKVVGLARATEMLMLQSRDHREFHASFAEKRKPKFEGR